MVRSVAASGPCGQFRDAMFAETLGTRALDH
jgi:hypothetical protein